MPETVLLTGATGFLGSHLLEALLSAGYDVVALKRSTSNTWRINHLLERIKCYNVDTVSLEEIFSRNSIGTVIHLATLYRKFHQSDEIRDMIASNVSFPVQLIEHGMRAGLRSFINTGTFFEYDCSRLPVNEQAPNRPFNLYAGTKLAFQTILAGYRERLSIVTLRLFSPYGPKDNENKLISMLIQNAIEGKEIDLSDGMQKLDFIYSEDVIQAYLKALTYTQNRGPHYEVFNIGSGVPVSVREVVSVLEQQMGKSINKKWGQPSAVDIPAVFADISWAGSALGWVPSVSIHEGLSRTREYFQRERGI